LDLEGESASSSPDETTRLDLEGQILGENEASPPAETKKKNPLTLSFVLIGLGLGLLLVTGVVFVKGNKYNKNL